MKPTLNITQADTGVYTVEFNATDQKVNVLSSSLFPELEAVVAELETKADIKLLIFKSTKPNNFIAGADIKDIQGIEKPEQAAELCNKGNAILNKIDQLPFPTLCVIDGACMGGGLELALAFDYRVCTDHPSTKIGLPEVNLGIIPGLGGTQRLPKLVGYTKAIELILNGKIISGVKAQKLGVVHKCVHREYLDTHLAKITGSLVAGVPLKKIFPEKKPKRPRLIRFLESNCLGRALIARKVKKKLLSKTKGHYPAPLQALRLLRKTYKISVQKGLKLETKTFSQLSCTQVSKNLIRLFFTSEALKKENWVAPTSSKPKLTKAAVIGAGTMGAGIAWLFNKKGIDISLKDLSYEALARGLQTCKRNYQHYIKTKKLSHREVEIKMLNVHCQTNHNGFCISDLVIEAVYENLELKNKILTETETELHKHAILASNTSSLSITEMAANLRRPERFIGLHFFNSPDRMPLVEVIYGKQTSDKTIYEAVQHIKKLGKTPIVVKDSPGFVVNRILVPYMTEAFFLLEEGTPLPAIEQTMKQFGMAMGPFELADYVGFDVIQNIAINFQEAFGEQAAIPALADRLAGQKNTLGMKTKKGFYDYNRNKRLNQAFLKFLLPQKVSKAPSSKQEITERVLYRMVNEAHRCIEEGVLQNEAFIDMAMILGTGFPPFEGGVVQYGNKIGQPKVYDQLCHYQDLHGKRFEPCNTLALNT